jgi:hypothetical protein
MAEQKFTIPEGRKTTPINSQIVVLYMKDVSTVPSDNILKAMFGLSIPPVVF